MSDKTGSRHLRVVRDAKAAAAEAERVAYWARLQALRAERERLRAG
ncbi:hypothetical protein N802_12345 [Knoellia sinensis KCTC 19936]|uniref:Uncharacterized protein n=1 Tax=Knoellia sinensis KCTC 19936 TaxID=1385520 RepID=A0A0A0JFL0_9MICO|nr:hypothetical protein [Knoellia sinensis]KGN34391.1 hypothetical protein N802_12345 [Knoellia sinensis KCTC 19936]